MAFATEQKFRQRIERLGIAVESLQPEQSQAELELALAEAVTELHAANMRKISLRATGVVGDSAVGVTIYQRI